MNAEIANRLQQLRKNNNLSQEELAEKIGVSRQAVSKWERAEASPDTENLILLSRLYNISLDELLLADSKPVSEGISLKKDNYKEPACVRTREMRPDNYTDEEIYPNRETVHNSIPQGAPFGADISEEESRKTNSRGNYDEFGDAMNRAGRAIGDAINAAGDRVREEMKRPGKDGKTFEDRIEKSMTKIGNGIEKAGRAVERSFDKLGEKMEEKEKRYANMYGYESSSTNSSRQSQKRKNKNKKGQNPPATLFDKLFCFLVLGVFFSCVGVGLAHPGWVLFLLIPFYYTTKNALRKRNLLLFCYPLLCAIIYFGIGGFLDTIWWSLAVCWYEIMWLLFLTIPLYYTGIVAIKKRNPLIFCYPVLCVIVYLGFGLVFSEISWWVSDAWFSAAWAPLAMSIPIYYIVISHFRQKSKAANGTQSTVSSAVD